MLITRKTLRPVNASRSREPVGSRRSLRDGPCPACGEDLKSELHSILYGGYAYHAECALYRRPARWT